MNNSNVKRDFESTRAWFAELFTLFAQPVPSVNTAAYTAEANKINTGIRAIFKRILLVPHTSEQDWNDATSELFSRSLQLVQKALQRVPIVAAYGNTIDTEHEGGNEDTTSTVTNVDNTGSNTTLFYHWLTNHLLELLLRPLPCQVLNSVIDTLVILDTAVTRCKMDGYQLSAELLLFMQGIWTILDSNKTKDIEMIWHQELPFIMIESTGQATLLLDRLWQFISKNVKGNNVESIKVWQLVVKYLDTEHSLTRPQQLTISVLNAIDQLLMTDTAMPTPDVFPHLIWCILSHAYCLCCHHVNSVESIEHQTVEASEKISNLLASILNRLIELKEQLITSINVIGRGWLEFTTFPDYWSMEYMNLKNAILTGLTTILAYRSPLPCTESWLLQGLSYDRLQDQIVQCLLIISKQQSTSSREDIIHQPTSNINDAPLSTNVKSTSKRTISIDEDVSDRKRVKLAESTNDNSNDLITKWPYDEQTQMIVDKLILNEINTTSSGIDFTSYAGVIRILVGKGISISVTTIYPLVKQTIESFLKILIDETSLDDCQSLYNNLVHLLNTVLDYIHYDNNDNEWLEMMEQFILLPWIQRGITANIQFRMDYKIQQQLEQTRPQSSPSFTLLSRYLRLHTSSDDGIVQLLINGIQQNPTWANDTWLEVPFIIPCLSKSHLNNLLEDISKIDITYADPSILASQIGYISCVTSGEGQIILCGSDGIRQWRVHCLLCDSASIDTTIYHRLSRSHSDTTIDLPLCNWTVQQLMRFRSLLSHRNNTSEQVQITAINSIGRCIAHASEEQLSSLTDNVIAYTVKLLFQSNRNIKVATSDMLERWASRCSCSGDLSTIESAIIASRVNTINSVFKCISRILRQHKARPSTDLIHTIERITCTGLREDQAEESIKLLVDLYENHSSLRRQILQSLVHMAKHYKYEHLGQWIELYTESLARHLFNQWVLKDDDYSSNITEYLTGQSMNEFLSETLVYTVPPIVLQQNDDHLATLTKRLRKSKPGEICMEALPRIFAHLLLEMPENLASIIQWLIDRLAARETIDISQVIHVCLVDLAMELLYELGDHRIEHQNQAHNALTFVIQMICNKDGTVDTREELTNSIGQLVRPHALALLSKFGSRLSNILDKLQRSAFPACSTKLIATCTKLIRGLGVFLSFLGNDTFNIYHQIISILQGLPDYSMVQEAAIYTWHILLRELGMEHREKIIVHYVAFAFSNANLHSKEMQRVIVDFLTELLSDCATMRGETLQLLGALQLPANTDYIELNLLQPWIKSMEPWTLARNQLKLMQHKSFIVVQLALQQFEQTLLQYPTLLTRSFDTNTVDRTSSLTSQAVSTCFDILYNYESNNRRIQRACVRCLGAIGAIDPTRVQISSPRKLSPLIALLQPPQICLDFAWSLIKDKLLQEFFAAPDATSQGHMAYTLQCMLAYCGMRTSTSEPSFFSPEWINAYWHRLSPDDCRTLEPFRSSRYSVKLQLPEEFPHPIYENQSSFRGWLSMWSQSLRKSLRSPHVRKLFNACKSAIASEECSVAQHLLPHLVLNALLDGTTDTRQSIIDEILVVLNDVKHWETSNEKRHSCVEMVASIVEQLFSWVKLQKRQAILRTPTHGSLSNILPPASLSDPITIASTISAQSINQIERLLAAIPRDLLAEAAFNCKAYARAFLHYEHYVREQRNCLNEEEMRPLYHRLQHMYTFADEPDIVDGISTKFTQKSVEQQIFEHETAGRWTAAQTCYELVIEQKPLLETHIGYINTLRQLGRLESLKIHVAGLKQQVQQQQQQQALVKSHAINQSDNTITMISNPTHWEPALNTELLATGWSLHQWDELDRLITNDNFEQSFESDLALILQAIKHRDTPLLEKRLESARDRLLPSLTAACAESYRRAYDQTLQLHILHDIEVFSIHQLDMLSSTKRDNTIAPIDWSARLQTTMATFKTREPILRLRRALLSLAQSESRVMGELWLNTSRLARRAGVEEMTHVAALHASQLGVPWAGLQLAKLYWQHGQRSAAIQLLDTLQQPQGDATPWTKTQKAKMDLLSVRWMEETGSSKSNVLIMKYTDIVKEHQEFEDGYFHFARYFNKLSDNQRNTIHTDNEHHLDNTKLQRQYREEKRVEYARHACKLYAQTLVVGSKYIHQAMPKLLTLWLDLGAQILPEREHAMRRLIDGKDKLGEHVKELNNSIIRRIDRIAPHQFLMAFSQMVSRICHPNSMVFTVLERLIIQVLVAYPQQALWSMMSVARSTYAKRSNRCAAILDKVKAMDKSGNLSQLIMNFTMLADELLVMANYKIRRNTKLSMSKQFAQLLRLAPSPVIVPLQRSLTVSTPSLRADTQPFPSDLPRIAGFEDEIETMASMQAPRKMTIIGSDGKRYIFLCKPKDDLRKDARLMEFYAMINQFLAKNPESRKRRLCIRTYAVVPLNETCGLIEWVNHTTGYRHILLKMYRAKGIQIPSGAEVKEMMSVTKSSLERVFVKQILPRFPRVFHEWFLEMYPDPMQWFSHRLNYANTAAVMSMVGYMVGLGDRHGENILLDESNGDCVHVDFNCLFEKGKKLAIPEVVPFRLTHNMVDALGVTGYEGVFRRSCEVTTQVLRDHTESLMSTLEAFAHDPLVEWNKPANSSSSNNSNSSKLNLHGGEIVNAKATESLEKIYNKLKGVQDSGLPLSVEGYVNELIREATNTKLLSEMYVGWAPYL